MSAPPRGSVLSPPSRGQWSVADWVVTATIALSVPLLLAHAAARGVIGVARNDDWVMLRDSFASVAAGHPVLDPWLSAMTVGQVVAAMPVVAVLGPSIAPLQAAVAAVGGVGLVFTYLFLRRFLPTSRAALAVAAVLLGPMYGALAVSFMTDVPTMALMSIALWLAASALDGAEVRPTWWAASLLAALGAFSIREYAAAVPLALALTLVLTRRQRSRRQATWALASLALWAVLAVGLYVARQQLSPSPLSGSLPDSARDPVAVVQMLSRAAVTTALLLCALVPTLLLGARRLVARRGVLVCVGLGLLLVTSALLLLRHHLVEWILPLGNYVSIRPGYSGDTLAGTAPNLFGARSLSALLAVGIVSSTVITLFVVIALRHRVGLREPPTERAEPWAKLATVFGITYVALVVGVAAARGAHPFDRYLLPAIPFLAGALLHRVPRLETAGRRGRAIVAVTTLATVALLGGGYFFVDATALNDAVRWRAGTVATTQGASPSTVDAGYEWFGFHQPGLADRVADMELAAAQGVNFWVTMYDTSRVCAIARYVDATASPDDGAILVEDRTWWGFRSAVAVSRVPARECLTVPVPTG